MMMVKEEEVKHVLIVKIVETSCWKPARVVDKGKFEKSTKYEALSNKYLKKKTNHSCLLLAISRDADLWC